MGPELLSQALPGDQYLLLREEILTFGLLLGSGELVIRQAELLAAHHLGLDLQSRVYLLSRGGSGFPESP